MSRRRIDPVQRAFDYWAALSKDEKQQFQWTMEGYKEAERDHLRAINGETPKPRKPKRQPAAATPEVK